MALTRRAFTLAGAASSLFAPNLLRAAAQPAITRMASGLDEPWAIGFLPQGGVLVTERGGALLLLNGAQRTALRGVPKVAARGQGGLLDICVPRDHASSKLVFLSYAKPQRGGAGTAVMRARLDRERGALTDVKTIFEMSAGSRGGRHFGSRLVEAPDGTLFLSIGDRGDDAEAQNLASHNGTILRMSKSGAAPADNPFVKTTGALPHIWSFGHRNPQGMALDRSARLWAHEHGAKGGDEINRISKGVNYGWPVISYGTHYSGRKIGEGTAKAGMQQPEYYWDPSIAPSGYTIHSKSGDHYVGSLKFDYIARLRGSALKEVQQIQSKDTIRVRDVREAPDGAIWFASVGNGALYRFMP